MVNYCCVKGCGRSSKLSAHLNYFSLPKERNRRYQWLAAAGRDDLIQNANPKKAYRICSRHFSIDCIKNRHLAPDTMPTLCLPDNNTDTSEMVVQYHDSVCDNCKNTIIGFRYKCVTCEDYDLCPKCEMLEYHSHHYMLRIPKPLKFKIADNLIQKWRSLFKAEHVKPDCDDDDTSGCSSDDEPISMHLARINDGGDLPDDVKAKIRGEVARVLAIKPDDKRKRKREKKNDSLLLKVPTKTSNKKAKMDVDEAPKEVQVSGSCEPVPAPEVAFADVNAYKDQMDIKNEVTAVAASEGEETVFGQPLMHVRLSDDLAELMIEISSTGEKSVYKYN